MCNRFRSIKEWSDIPRRFHSGPRLNFAFNPNVAPTELVPALVAGEDVVLARFGINRLGSADKSRPPLLNVRTDGMRRITPNCAVPDVNKGSRMTAARGHTWRNFSEQFQPCTTDGVFEDAKAGGITARVRQAFDQAGPDRIGDAHKHDRHRAGRLLECDTAWSCHSDNDVRRECE